MLGGGHRVEQLAELEPLVPEGALGEFSFGGSGAGGLAELVAQEDRFQCERWLGALVAGDFRIQRRDGVGDDDGFIVEVVHALEQLGGLGEAGFEAFGGLELLHHPLLDGGFFGLENDGLGLFERHDEVAVLFHLALGDFKPLLPVLGDDLGDELLLDLIERGFAAVAVEDEFDHPDVVASGHLAQAVQVGGFLGEDVAGGDGFQRVSGEGQIHLVASFALEIDRELAKNRVHRRDAPEAPALVRAVATLSQSEQRLDVLAADFPRDGQFFQFVSHSFK
ncbi:MAG: hypothetical protein B9S33_21160 [Pedosphaera sp. Tous-C6FEB]|nr:MAG: hypothetical protein B9S33_21160 [Pedosphaera sp. Tous-C6FEB]